MSYDITEANVIDWTAAYDGEPFHALLCDPPYHLSEIVKRFGAPDAAPAQYGRDGAFQRTSRGFMGKQWDGGDIAFRPETWAAFARLLYPGAFGMAFASTRGFHRMACAIEDAGFIIHPMIAWNFASGFPKATRIDVQVDRQAGAERAIVGSKRQAGAKFKLTQELIDNGGFNDPSRAAYDVTAPATELAQAWEGHRYGLQALKPAIEPIIVFQRPYQGRPVDSITRTGAGALWIDGGRVGTGGEIIHAPQSNPQNRSGIVGSDLGISRASLGAMREAQRESIERANDLGRWPANLVLSHAPGCNGECVDGCPIRALGEQSGESESKASQRGAVEIFHEAYKGAPGWVGDSTERGHDDTGTAARFFFNADYALERLEAADGLIYVPKASTAEREAGLDGFALTTVDDGRQTPIDNAYLRGETTRRNTHPTIKPIALARHLATLLLPPERYAPRRLFVPFAGAASEMIGAMLAGWEDVQGVELEAEHIPIARARLAYWQQRRAELSDPSKPVKTRLASVPDGQMDMFADAAA